MNVIQLIKSGMLASTDLVIKGALMALPGSAVIAIVWALFGNFGLLGLIVVVLFQLFAGYAISGWINTRGRS